MFGIVSTAQSLLAYSGTCYTSGLIPSLVKFFLAFHKNETQIIWGALNGLSGRIKFMPFEILGSFAEYEHKCIMAQLIYLQKCY